MASYVIAFSLALSCFLPAFLIATGFIGGKFLVLFFNCNVAQNVEHNQKNGYLIIIDYGLAFRWVMNKVGSILTFNVVHMESWIQ